MEKQNDWRKLNTQANIQMWYQDMLRYKVSHIILICEQLS